MTERKNQNMGKKNQAFPNSKDQNIISPDKPTTGHLSVHFKDNMFMSSKLDISDDESMHMKFDPQS